MNFATDGVGIFEEPVRSTVLNAVIAAPPESTPHQSPLLFLHSVSKNA